MVVQSNSTREEAVASSTWFSRFVESYRRDHSHPVNHFLHLFVGWPLVALAVLLLPFRPLWSPVLVIVAYSFMFSGHFIFEKNRPTILSKPSTPFVIAWAVILDLTRRCSRLLGIARSTSNR